VSLLTSTAIVAGSVNVIGPVAFSVTSYWVPTSVHVVMLAGSVRSMTQ
jgi:hypothetical protein